MTPEDWDMWRSRPDTKEAFQEILKLTQEQWGNEADEIARNGYRSLFANSFNQIDYARLRGHMECVNYLMEAIKQPLDELRIDEERNEENRPKDV